MTKKAILKNLGLSKSKLEALETKLIDTVICPYKDVEGYRSLRSSIYDVQFSIDSIVETIRFIAHS